MDAAEAHRLNINERFYDCPPQFHRNLADMYVSDPRFTATYDEIRPGMAHYVRDAIHANADRRRLSRRAVTPPRRYAAWPSRPRGTPRGVGPVRPLA